MEIRKNSARRFYLFLSALSVPFLTISSPNWLEIQGISPDWVVLWLLPWSLRKGSIAGIYAGFCFGMLLDAINLNGATTVPMMVILGFFWGNLGSKGIIFENIFGLGILAWLGSTFIGIGIWIQYCFLMKDVRNLSVFNAWSLHTIITQATMTAFLAPMISYLLLKLNKSYANSR